MLIFFPTQTSPISILNCSLSYSYISGSVVHIVFCSTPLQIIHSVIGLIFEPNDTTLKSQFDGIVNSILSDIKSKRGFTDYKLQTSQTAEQMDTHELSAKLWVKPTPTLEYIEIEFMVTPQGVEFED